MNKIKLKMLDNKKEKSDNLLDNHMINTVLTEEVDRPDQEALNISQVCLIRHGTTDFNVEF